MQPVFLPVLEYSVYIYRRAFSCNSTGILVRKDRGEKQSEDVGGESQMAWAGQQEMDTIVHFLKWEMSAYIFAFVEYSQKMCWGLIKCTLCAFSSMFSTVNFIDMQHAWFIVLCSWHVYRDNIPLYTYGNEKDTYALVFRIFTKQRGSFNTDVSISYCFVTGSQTM